ncbi:hypothetical protein AAG570_002292 [Ranatra chinensis]|uniref:DEUBAD domain-containing protein n=1 Tax=Ranatra chinensis TaxID=642074 RepID=A0ABD0Y754_9HEMI
MASKRQNMFHKNKTQETTENVNFSRPSTSQSPRSGGSSSGGNSTTAVATPPQPSTPAAPNNTPSTPVVASKPGSTPSAPTKQNRHAPIQLSHLQSYLSGLGVQNQGQGSASSGQQVDLSSSITTESLQAILNDPGLVRELQRHLPSLGSDASQQEQLRSTLASPQFQQASQLGPVVSQFEVGADAVSAANQGNMEEFVRALQAATISSGSGQEDKKKEEETPKKSDSSTDEKKKKKKKPNEEEDMEEDN